MDFSQIKECKAGIPVLLLNNTGQGFYYNAKTNIMKEKAHDC